MSLFMPDMMLNSVTHIDKQLMDNMGIKAIILDVDNTLRISGSLEPYKGIAQWVKNMKQYNFPLIIVSNNTKKTVGPFARLLDIDYFSFCCKPFPYGFSRAVRKMNIAPEQIAVVGDQIFTDVVGGNLKGMKTILVEPFKKEKGGISKIKRKLEKRYINIYKKNNSDT